MSSSSSSNSDSSQRSETNNVDARVAGGEGSYNLSTVNSSVNVSLTDQGAVTQAFGFSREALGKSLEFAEAADKRAGVLVADALDNVQNAVDQIKDAYSEAKAGEQKVLVAGGLIIAGIVAVQALKGARA